MDKQNKYSARPQGFRGNYRPEPAKVQEEAPLKKKRPPKKKLRKKRAKRRQQRRRQANIKKWLLLGVAVLILALLAALIIRIAVANANKTVHMLPEIYDIETNEEDTNIFMAASEIEAAFTQAEDAAGGNFIPEVGGE